MKVPGDEPRDESVDDHELGVRGAMAAIFQAPLQGSQASRRKEMSSWSEVGRERVCGPVDDKRWNLRIRIGRSRIDTEARRGVTPRSEHRQGRRVEGSDAQRVNRQVVQRTNPMNVAVFFCTDAARDSRKSEGEPSPELEAPESRNIPFQHPLSTAL